MNDRGVAPVPFLSSGLLATWRLPSAVTSLLERLYMLSFSGELPFCSAGVEKVGVGNISAGHLPLLGWAAWEPLGGQAGAAAPNQPPQRVYLCGNLPKPEAGLGDPSARE